MQMHEQRNARSQKESKDISIVFPHEQTKVGINLETLTVLQWPLQLPDSLSLHPFPSPEVVIEFEKLKSKIHFCDFVERRWIIGLGHGIGTRLVVVLLLLLQEIGDRYARKDNGCIRILSQ